MDMKGGSTSRSGPNGNNSPFDKSTQSLPGSLDVSEVDYHMPDNPKNGSTMAARATAFKDGQIQKRRDRSCVSTRKKAVRQRGCGRSSMDQSLEHQDDP